MQVFTEFIKSDLTEDQILPVLRDLLPVLLTILGSGEVPFFPLSFAMALRSDLTIVTLGTNPCANCFCVQTMCRCIVHGERSASAGSKGSRRIRSSCLVGGVQSPPVHRSSTRRNKRQQLGRSYHTDTDIQGMFSGVIFLTSYSPT